MKKFMDNDFLLETETSKKLYHDYAKEMPIFDYHCHLSAKEIAENKKYKNMTEIWLGGDHYKWRAMRSYGVDESFITGDKSDKEKFTIWAEVLSNAMGNPLYHWSHLELQRYFGIQETLNSKNSDIIWDKCNFLLKKDEFSAKELIKKSNVKGICTTDDPIDNLEYHKMIKNDKDFNVKVLPTFRPDKAVNIEKDGFSEYINELSKVTGHAIDSYKKLCEALTERIDYFHEVGCRISDHGLDTAQYLEGTKEELEIIFSKGLLKKELNEKEIKIYKGQFINYLGKEYNKRKWTMQLHMGALRNNSKRMFESLGADTGFDSIGDLNCAEDLSKLLNSLDYTKELPKTILYSLNPKDNYVLATMIGNFQGDGIPSKIQFGSGWWFNDQKDGMELQLKTLGNLGVLSKFVGMLTDSRSFLSFTRHEYFRRILCNIIGKWVENGEFPEDYNILEKIVKGISFENAENYFGVEL
ncbi:MAG: glucuronate isomerase [Fusobacteriaceae bacterium]